MWPDIVFRTVVAGLASRVKNTCRMLSADIKKGPRFGGLYYLRMLPVSQQQAEACR